MKTTKQRTKTERKENRISKDCGITKKGMTYVVMGLPGGEEREKRKEEIFETRMTENFPKLRSDTKPPI